MTFHKRLCLLVALAVVSASNSALLRAQATAAAAQEGSDDVVDLDRIEVNGQRDSAYGAATALSSSKIPITLLENSQNIQVIPRGFIEDQGALNLDDVLRNVAGVMPGGYYANWDYYRIRGFDASFNTFIDGLRDNNGMSEELFGLEQVEIVKGPTSTLFGQAPLGGMVNIVSKKPVFGRAFNEVGAEVGTNHFLEGSLDTNQSLSKDGSVVGRFLALHREFDSYVDYVGSKREFFAGSVSWRIAPSTLLTVYGRYRSNNENHRMPLPAAGTILPNPNGKLPLDVYNGEPGRSNHVSERMNMAGWELEHRVNARLTLRQNTRFGNYEQVWDNILYPLSLDSSQRFLLRYPYSYHQTWHDISLDNRAEMRVITGPVKHLIMAGVDFFVHSYDYQAATVDFSDAASFIPIDLYQPVYGTAIPAIPSVSGGVETSKLTGFYAQDHLKLPHNLTVSLGGRFGIAQTAAYRDTAFTPHVGLTWEFRPGLAAFANRGESFNPQSGSYRTASGDHVEPEEGENYEIGLKSAAADGRLTATLALFELTRKNVATADPLRPNVFLVSGEQRSRGVEFDGRFNPSPGWELTLAYAYTDARITEDTVLPVNARTAGVPLNSISFWTKYTLQRGPLKGLGVGVGERYYSSQVGDSTYAAPFDLPPYGLTDAALYYRKGNLQLQLNVDNVFDREYYTGSYDRLYVLPGDTRSIRLSTTWSF